MSPFPAKTDGPSRSQWLGYASARQPCDVSALWLCYSHGARAAACRNISGAKDGNTILSLWAALVLLVLSSGAWAQSSHAAPTQSKGIDPALPAKAKAGDADGEFLVRLVYRIGEDVPQDNALDAAWIQKAAVQGQVGAQQVLGWIYEKGEGLEQNYVQSARWFRKHGPRSATA